MAFCGNCGSHIEQGVKFCPACGSASGVTDFAASSGMLHVTRNNGCVMKSKNSIVILSLISLILTILGSMSYFITWEFDNDIVFAFPDIITIIDFLLWVAPNILLLIYVLNFNKLYKNRIMLLLTVGVLFLYVIYYVIIYIALYKQDVLIYDMIWFVFTTLGFAFSLQGILTGFSEKIMFIIAMVIFILAELISRLYILEIIEYLEVFPFDALFNALGKILLYVALLVLCVNNQIISKTKQPQKNSWNNYSQNRF